MVGGNMMANRRMIDPAFWESEKVAHLSLFERCLFLGIISNADDQGRVKAALIRSKVFPLDDFTQAEISAALDAITEQNGVIVYQVDDVQYVQVRKWWNYQRPSWAWPSKHPAPEGWSDVPPGRRYDRSEAQPLDHDWIRAHSRLIRWEAPNWRDARAAVLERDSHTCRYCGRSADQVDHVFPKSRGGTDHLFNLVAACRSCNLAKGTVPLPDDEMESIYSANLEGAWPAAE
jgi:hypothetical protein